jgi:hypothetical protein
MNIVFLNQIKITGKSLFFIKLIQLRLDRVIIPLLVHYQTSFY